MLINYLWHIHSVIILIDIIMIIDLVTIYIYIYIYIYILFYFYRLYFKFIYESFSKKWHFLSDSTWDPNLLLGIKTLHENPDCLYFFERKYFEEA